METAFIVFAVVSPITYAIAQVIVVSMILKQSNVKWKDKVDAIARLFGK